jgi:transcriptional regulator with XRE-family HTH domain
MTQSSSEPDIFLERLKAARTKRGLSQEGLAKLASLQASAISHFETGTRKPSFDNLRRLADALAVTTDYLLGRVEKEQELAHSSDALYRDLDQLSNADREMARDFLQLLADKARKRAGDDGQ